MERYIKPSCEITEIVENCNLLSLSTNSITTTKPAYSPKQNSITPSLAQPDLWEEEEESDIDYYMEAYEK